jgi:hypothetical protein
MRNKLKGRRSSRGNGMKTPERSMLKGVDSVLAVLIETVFAGGGGKPKPVKTWWRTRVAGLGTFFEI